MESIHSWHSFVQPILNGYAVQDVYNAEKSGQFYNLLPHKTLAIKGDHYFGGKRSKAHLTLLLCCNMGASDKMKPLLKMKSANPCAFHGICEFSCV